MNWKRYSFSRHYKNVHVEGESPQRLINLCLLRNINLRRIIIISEKEVSFEVKDKDYESLYELAGRRYKIRVSMDRGHNYRIIQFLNKKTLMAGLILFVGIIFYQSQFVSEIDIMGYESISEQSIRQSLKAAGFYEGCRKNVNIDKVKLCLYEDFDNIAWVGIKYKGNMAQLTIVETEYLYENYNVSEEKPCNIIAAESGYINRVDPEEGVRVVKDKAYVKEGDVIISGEVPLERNTYEEDKIENVMYVHAAGEVEAKVPVRLNFFTESNNLTKEKTGKRTFTISVNDEVLLNELCSYELSVVKHITLINWVKPVKLKIQLNIVEEVKVKHDKKNVKEVEKQVLNEIHKYTEEKLPDNAQILNKSLNFTQEKNIIRVGVTLETLQEIGIEEEIVVDKSNRQSDQNDDQ